MTPPGTPISSLITVCNEYVMQLRPLMKNSTWIFLVKTKEWEQVDIHGENPNPYSFGFGTAAVTIIDARTACYCRQAILFIPCGRREVNISSLHQLICVNDSGRMSYRWTTISTNKYPRHPVTILCQSVISSPSKKMVFAVIDGCLSYYVDDTATWTLTTSCWKRLISGFSADFPPVLSAAGLGIDHRVTTYLFVDLWALLVIRLGFNLPVTSERILGTGPLLDKIYLIRALSNDQFLAYANEKYYCGTSKWILKRDNVSAIWIWSRLLTTARFSYSKVFTISSIRHHNIYQLVKTETDPVSRTYPVSRTWHYLLWVLDLNLMRWQVMQKFSESATMASSRSASTWFEEDMWLIVSRSQTTVIKSMKPISKIINPMTRREYFTVVAINRTSALLFGGLTDDKSRHALNDLWHFSSTTGNWEEVRLDRPGTLIPSPRFNHAAAVIDSEMFVLGGHNNSDVCFEDLWRFDVDQGAWSIAEVRNRGPRLAGLQPCVASAVAQAGQLWVAFGCGYFRLNDISCLDSNIQIWMFIAHLAMWEPLKVYKVDLLMGFPLLRLGFWDGYLFSLATTQSALLYMKVGCPRGLASKDISMVACDICEVGSYADLGSRDCLLCPKGTTTKEQRSTSVSDCNICVEGYCQHGRCLVVTTNSTQSPYCQCQFGFTGSHCQYATYYYISLGVILFVVAICLSLTIIWYIRRKKKLNEGLLCRQIEQLNEVWQIGWEEITVQEEIGGGASGRVLLAQYRDLPVAVKMLRTDDDPNDSLKFAEEIKFMQTIRHPNIVLFLGAGKTTPQEQPFLVLEFTRRGSLRKVLDDESIHFTNRRKLDFAIDAGKGMSFLHNLYPPRIHRDLKGENLLVSESWVVKVADFGLGRPFNSENTRQPAQRKKHSFFKKRSLTQPLLEAREELSLDGIGTARWSAPELSKGEKYDGSIDVYRYTTVMKLI